MGLGLMGLESDGAGSDELLTPLNLKFSPLQNRDMNIPCLIGHHEASVS